MLIDITEREYNEMCNLSEKLPFLILEKGSTPKGKQKIEISCKQGKLTTFYHDLDLIENLVNAAIAMREIIYDLKIQRLEQEKNGY
jgi:hypothetical protein